jgi:hypothetical protein
MAGFPIAPKKWLDEEDTPTWPGVAVARELVVLAVEVTLSSESRLVADPSGCAPAGGVFVQTDRRLAIGDRVGLLLSMPTGQVEALGVVKGIRAWEAGTSLGVEIAFEDMPSEAHARVAAFCRLRAPIAPVWAPDR